MTIQTMQDAKDFMKNNYGGTFRFKDTDFGDSYIEYVLYFKNYKDRFVMSSHKSGYGWMDAGNKYYTEDEAITFILENAEYINEKLENSFEF